MLRLEQTEHSYYCECWESGRTQEFESWQDFKDEVGLDYDFDYNLLFRFDLNYEDEPEDKYYKTYTLQLHHALQRHGSEQWHAVIHNITENDIAEINEHLRNAKKHLLDLWDINDKIRMYKKWKIKMYNFVQNYFQKNVHFYIDINMGRNRY